MALRQQQELKQTLRLSPLQMQMMKLFELNSIEIEDKIKQELEDNPALDESDGISSDDENLSDNDNEMSQEELMMGDYFSEDDIPQYQMNRWERSNEHGFSEISFTGSSSLNDFLTDQIRLRELEDGDQKIAEYIIGNLDENGYLSRSLQAISDDLLFQQNIDVNEDKLKEILTVIQDLDPVGVGSVNLQECLILQLKKKQQTESIVLATTILEDYFEEFSKKHYDKLLRNLSISKDQLRDSIEEITSLNPKPGNIFSDAIESHMNNITPDFIVETNNNEITMYLNNRNIPELKISREFSHMMQGYANNKESMSNDNKQALLYMKQKVDSAKWFISALKQRQNTLQRTMEAIINFQYDFFISEDESMIKPMILKDIAEKTGFEISTISRVSNSKYVQTNSGIYPLKYFFAESFQNEEGDDISTREIKAVLQNIIDKENKQKPYTDEKLTSKLKEKGYAIARRTVAKYREQMNIPVARLRKIV